MMISSSMISLLIRVLEKTPFYFRLQLGNLIGLCIALVPSRANKISDLQMKRFLNLQSTFSLRCRMFMHFARCALLNISLTEYVKHKAYSISCNDPELLHNIKHSKRTCFTFTAHTGNWELLAAHFNEFGTPITTMARKARHPAVQKLVSRLRMENNVNTLWREDSGALKNLLKAIKEHHIIAALIDQDTQVQSVHIPFMGIPAKTPHTLCDLAKKHKADIYFAFNAFKNNTLIIDVQRCDSSLSTEEILLLYHQSLERFIRQYPEQWVWFHKRWRTPSKHKSLTHEEYIAYLQA